MGDYLRSYLLPFFAGIEIEGRDIRGGMLCDLRVATLCVKNSAFQLLPYESLWSHRSAWALFPQASLECSRAEGTGDDNIRKWGGLETIGAWHGRMRNDHLEYSTISSVTYCYYILPYYFAIAIENCLRLYHELCRLLIIVVMQNSLSSLSRSMAK